ncbi:MAG: N-acetylmuramoyl-L-alanine amidase [Chitinophagaceae bacterium]|nr:N-acetylmuramoyl-L-alanine amidase [Chitinophagaceae bacterium]
MKNFRFISVLFLLLLAACHQSRFAATNKVYKKQVKAFSRLIKAYPLRDSAGVAWSREWVGTTNLSLRKPNYVIIHHTAQNSCEQTLKTFTLPRTQVSAHYVICRDGTVYHMLNDMLRAHHAGVGKWGNITDMNSMSIGIELDNNGNEPFAEAQIQSLLVLLSRLKKTFQIPQSNFIGHLDWAPGRKTDPGRFFP